VIPLLAALCDSTEWLAGRIDALGYGAGSAAVETAYDPPHSVMLCSMHARASEVEERSVRRRGASRLAGVTRPLRAWLCREMPNAAGGGAGRSGVVSRDREARCCSRAGLAVALAGAAHLVRSQALATNLAALSDKLRALSEKVVFALRLEVRVRCYHHLQSIREVRYEEASLATQPDAFVVELNKELTAMATELAAYMSVSKVSYVFGGVEAVQGRILVGSMAFVTQVSTAGIGKLERNVVALQQTLSSLVAVDEVHYERARSYFELLKLSIKKFLSTVSDASLDFSAEDFRHALRIISGGRVVESAVEILERLLQQQA